MELHACETCGLQHGGAGELPPRPESDEVAIARIQAERDVEVARLAARESREANETMVDVAEVQAAADVAEAEATAEVVGAVLAAEAESDQPPAPDPVIVDAPAPEPEPDLAPPPAEPQHHEPKRRPLWPTG